MVRQVLSLKGLDKIEAHVVVELADGALSALPISRGLPSRTSPSCAALAFLRRCTPVCALSKHELLRCCLVPVNQACCPPMPMPMPMSRFSPDACPLAAVDNAELVKLIAPEMCEVIVAHDIIGRLMIQCARQPGLAHVLENLMGFDGDEFYLQNWPELEGEKFGDISFRFDDAVPIGVKVAKTGKININPDPGFKICEGDKILVLAEDNDSYTVNDGSYKVKIKPVEDTPKKELTRERLMFCGWRRDMFDMIIELDQYVAPGSELWLFNMVPCNQRVEMLKDKGHKGNLELRNLVIKNAMGNPIVRRDLMKITELEVDGTGDYFHHFRPPIMVAPTACHAF